MREHVFSPGKVDYNGSGRRNCKVTIKWSLVEGRFSMSGSIWNPRETGCYSCGQNLETIAELFPLNKRVQEMVAIWRDWHLNDLQAGSPAQREYLKAHPITDRDHYKAACAALAGAGLNPDPSYEHKGKPYAYGSAWLKKDIPAEIAAQISSWN